MQIINKVFNYKSIFGFANLEIKYGMNSSWHVFLSLFYFNYINLKVIYLINFIPVTLYFYESYKCTLKKKKTFSDFFLVISSFFAIFYTVIHPSGNGNIFGQMGSVDVDIVPAFLSLLIIYLSLKIIENEDINYNYNLILILTIICFVSKISYVAIGIFCFIFFYYLKKKLFPELILYVLL